MANEIVSVLAGTSVAVTAAILLVLLLRLPLRRLLGSELAYQAWLLVPALIVAALLPRPAADHKTAVVTLVRSSTSAVTSAVQPIADWSPVAVAIWLAGASALAAFFWLTHVGFVRSLGTLVPNGGLYFSGSRSAGPALLGLLSPRIVVPADFAERYSEQEQLLIVEHERVHAGRRDVAVNLLQAALQCVFWFNPVVHLAALRFRADQEMACDAAVLRRHPGLLRTYAEALLKSQTFPTAVPLTVACTWRIHHPVKERFMTLQQTQPGARRRLFGRVLVGSLVLGLGYLGVAARADEAPGPGYYDVRLTLTMDDQKSEPRIITRAGETVAVKMLPLNGEFVITPMSAKPHAFKAALRITDGADTVVKPVIIALAGQSVGVSGNYKDGTGAMHKYDLKMLVQETTTPGPEQPK